ncbi:hypothetical protein [Holospora elegans]|uniref:hypothetical protein n=1 Tax=Holospora elegans TaxID=431043 RepID=UPI001FA80097|nr:hypothetical protein [Holospora elegans]
MKVVIAVDKIYGDGVSGLVEKMQNTLAKLFGREEQSIIAHIFFFDGVQVGAREGK